MNIKKIFLGGLTTSLVVLALAVPAYAASTIVVTPANTQGWSFTAPLADTRPGGAVTFVTDSTSPAPTGALQLTTDLTTTAKAQYLHAANTPLADVNDLSYYTKQVSAPFPGADPSYQLPVFLNGSTGFTTLVFEPYQNTGNNGNPSVINNVWQKWNVATGLFWSTRTVTCSNGTIVGTPGGPASYTLAMIKAACPNATVIEYGVNIGSNNPGYVVRTDLFNFNGTTYNFEVTNMPTDAKQCKNGGFVNFTDAKGNTFTNQGQCVRFVENHKEGKDDNNKGDNKDNQDGQNQDGQNDGNQGSGQQND